MMLFDPALGCLDRLIEPGMLDLLTFFNAETFKYLDDTVGTRTGASGCLQVKHKI